MKCDKCGSDEAQSFSVNGQIFCLCPECMERYKDVPIELLKGVMNG